MVGKNNTSDPCRPEEHFLIFTLEGKRVKLFIKKGNFCI